MNSTDLIYTEDQQEKILEEIKNPQNKEGLPSASLVYSVINLLAMYYCHQFFKWPLIQIC